MQLHACRFRLGRKKHTEFVLQFSIFNFLTVFDIKITKSPRIPNLKRKVDISSNLNGLFHQFKLELFIDVIFMKNTEMWNKYPRENDLLKCIVVTHGCTGQTSILKVGAGGTTYILPPKCIFSIVISKVCPQFLLQYASSIFVSTRSYAKRITTCIH